MKWILVLILGYFMALWVLQRLLAFTARRDEVFRALHREKIREALERRAL